MAVIKVNDEQVKILARLMRAEAEGEGMVYQRPGGFEATLKGYFYQSARDRDIALARRVINGERQRPASNALWFFRPSGDCPRVY